MDIHNIDLNNINVDNNFDEDEPDSIILIRLLAWHIKLEKRKELKKFISEELKKNTSEELMAIVWHLKRWWNWCLPEDEKNEIEPIFIEELQKCASVVYHMEVLKHFIEECAGSIQWEVWENFG